jgi:hypothetical protein
VCWNFCLYISYVTFQRNLIREATAFLLDVLKPNLPEHGYLQTKVHIFYVLLSVSLNSMVLYKYTFLLFIKVTFFNVLFLGSGNKSCDISKCC